ncbi:hypothetical protein V493_05441 [Pseudogymnoascus sp. VKM F-4281 (FW-2241)]|nr:hypothetical protein V493_05441 [Pseudogymnoascus sp. VKM F-4281 (FW-2241)]
MSGTTPSDVDPLKVVIIGAGIGGLALAQILNSAPGISVTCYERRDAAYDPVVGFRVMLSSTTLGTLKRKLESGTYAHLALGIGEQPEGGEKIEFFKGNGDKLFTWDSNPTTDQFSVSRWHLREGLVQKAPFLRPGVAFERYEVLPEGGARAHFSDGSSDDCDLLVGADGPNSKVRKQLIPNATVKEVGMAVIYFKVPLTQRTLRLLASPGRSMVTPPCHSHLRSPKANSTHTFCPNNQYIMLAPWQNPLAPFATRYTRHTIDPDESYIMLGAGSPYANFHNRRCFPNELTTAELQAELVVRTSQPGMHPNFRELIKMACLDTVYVNIVRKSEPVKAWTSPYVTLLGDSVFNMSNTLSRGANCAILDAVSLADSITSPTYRRERHQPTALDDYVRENIERRQVERQRSYMMQKIMFSGQNRLRGFVRDKALPHKLKRIDDLDREEHGRTNWIGSDEELSLGSKEDDPKWVEELKWDEIFEERHGNTLV